MTRRLAAALLLLCACGGASETPGDIPDPMVEVAPVAREAVDESLRLVGQLEAVDSVMLRPETEGVVESIEFRDGQEVQRGTVLVKLRDGEQRARLREASARLVLAQRAFDRVNRLEGDKILAEAELDEAKANLEAAHAAVDLARVELERMSIRAPFDGVLGARQVSPGDRVSEQSDIVSIDAVADLRVAFSVPEPLVDHVESGMSIGVTVAARPDERFPGRVDFVAPAFDPASRQLLLKGVVPNPDRRLRPGMFAIVHVETGQPREALFAPESALIADPTGTFVFRIDEHGVAERVPVEVGERRRGQAEIRTGLSEGDRIVVAGTHKVVAGRPVQVASRPTAGGPAS